MAQNYTSDAPSDARMGFLENVLDSYDQVAYHFTFFMMNEATSKASAISPESGMVFDPANRHILIESGVTSSYLIDDVSITNILGPGREQRTSTAYDFEFTVYEPGGATFLDTLYDTSLSLGISNYYKCPYYFELTFRARTVESSEPKKLEQSWCWPLVIVSVETSITAAGTSYKFKATLYAQMSSSEQYGLIKRNVKASGSTIGPILKNLEDELNAQAQSMQSMGHHSIRDDYEINVNPLLAQYAGVNAGSINKRVEASLSMASGESSDNSKLQATTTDPITITKYIDIVMSASEEYEEKLKNTMSAQGTDPNQSSANITRKLHRILIQTRMKDYDPYRGDYAHTYIYNILPYEIGTLQCTAKELSTVKMGVDRYDLYRNRKWLQKRYDYIFTGLNDQILNLDLNFNLSWFVRVPVTKDMVSGTSDQSGNVSGYESVQIPNKKGTETAPEAKVEYKVLKSEENIPVDIQEKTDEVIMPEQDDDITFISDEEASRLYEENQMAQDIREGDLSEGNELRSIRRNLIRARRAKNTRKPVIKDLAYETLSASTSASTSASASNNTGSDTRTGKATQGTPPTELSSESSDIMSGMEKSLPKSMSATYVQSNATYSSVANAVSSSSTKNRVWPISYIENVIPKQLSDIDSSANASGSAGRKYVEFMFAQAFSAKSGDLVNLDITIKGDPYWLSPAPFENGPSGITAITNSVATEDYTPTNTSANGIANQNYLLLTLRTPSEANEDTGLISVAGASNTFSGVYGVITVKNSFNNGLFSQVLSCLIDPLIKYTDIQESEGD